MFFWLKKLLGYWIMPLPFCLALLVAGLLLLRTRRRRLGTGLLGVSTVLLLLGANKAVSGWLISPLEHTYPAIPEITTPAQIPANLRACRFVAVLGAGNGNEPGIAALDLLSTSARARISEAVRIMRLLPDARLLVSGPAQGTHVSHATVLERAALSLGVDPARIIRIEHARDTEDESLAVKRHAGDAPVALVTSAWHMPRAAALFRSAGVTFVACPTDYLGFSDGHLYWRDLLWDFESVERSSFAIRERAGQVWITLRGKNR